MAYYMSNGVKVSEGAAGLGAMPPQAAAGLAAYFGRDDPQAAANGMGRLAWRRRGVSGLGQANGCPPGMQPVYDVLEGKTVCAPAELFGPTFKPPAGAADPIHGGAYSGSATSRFGCMMEFQRTNDYALYEACQRAISLRNQIATEGSQPIPFGTSMRVFREGILGGSGLAPDSFGVRTAPFRDGIFGGGLGQDAGNGNGAAAQPADELPLPADEPPADDKILGMSPATLTAVAVGGVVILVGVLALRRK